jgi:3-hydroxyisobutyrate dehydrogenase-like beta-hydroxyacid dehydrogenase
MKAEELDRSMATNLLNAGYALRVYNRTASKAESLVAQGAYLASRPVDAVTSEGLSRALCGMTRIWKASSC